jgi:hypothetical protein
MDGYWLSEPEIPRTARGMKNRVARLKALGNCVVPMQAYPIFHAIAESEFFMTNKSEVFDMDKSGNQGDLP